MCWLGLGSSQWDWLSNVGGLGLPGGLGYPSGLSWVGLVGGAVLMRWVILLGWDGHAGIPIGLVLLIGLSSWVGWVSCRVGLS